MKRKSASRRENRRFSPFARAELAAPGTFQSPKARKQSKRKINGERTRDLRRANPFGRAKSERQPARRRGNVGDFIGVAFTQTLKRFATYFDLESGASRSVYNTPEAIAAATNYKPKAEI